MVLDIYVTYQGQNTHAPGQPGAGARITVSFDNATGQVGGEPNATFWGPLGHDVENRIYPVVSAMFSPNAWWIQGNINNFYAEANVDASSTPLTGTITTTTAFVYPVVIGIGGTGITAQLEPSQMSATFSLTPPSAASGTAKSASRAPHGLPHEVRRLLEAR